MKSVRAFKLKLAELHRLWEEKEYDDALNIVETLRKERPGNPHLHVLWASLVQLQAHPTHSLDAVKQALRDAVDLDSKSPEPAIELGHFLDTVEDDPKAAAAAFGDGAIAARRLLIDALIGQARAYHQLDRQEELLGCVTEVLNLARFDPPARHNGSRNRGVRVVVELPGGTYNAVHLREPYAEEVQDLLREVAAGRAA